MRASDRAALATSQAGWPFASLVLVALDHDASPLLLICTQADGMVDNSPRGDVPGFVKVVDDHTLLIPDRRGNNRLDTLRNIVRNPAVGLLKRV